MELAYQNDVAPYVVEHTPNSHCWPEQGEDPGRVSDLCLQIHTRTHTHTHTHTDTHTHGDTHNNIYSMDNTHQHSWERLDQLRYCDWKVWLSHVTPSGILPVKSYHRLIHWSVAWYNVINTMYACTVRCIQLYFNFTQHTVMHCILLACTDILTDRQTDLKINIHGWWMVSPVLLDILVCLIHLNNATSIGEFITT